MTEHHETLIMLHHRAERFSEMLDGFWDDIIEARLKETGVSVGAEDALKAMYRVIDNLQTRIDIEEDKEAGYV